MRTLAVLAVLPCASGFGAGVWKDPNHYKDDNSLAGLRFVSESPPHHLSLVGTDDGTKWFALKGTCSGEMMSDISFDFSPKGGPKDVTGKHTGEPADRPLDNQKITFPDGNAWSMLDKPTAAFFNGDGVVDHVGVFFDPGHFKNFDSWAGFRFIAEDASALHMVGSDDGTWMKMWYLKGSITGEAKTQIHFDFSPKGGPADLEGTWSTAPAAITWPDGNAWTKVPAAVTTTEEEAEEPSTPAASTPAVNLAESTAAANETSGGFANVGSLALLVAVVALAGYGYAKRSGSDDKHRPKPLAPI